MDTALQFPGITRRQWTAEARPRSIGQVQRPQPLRVRTARAHGPVWSSAIARILAPPVHRIALVAAAKLVQRDRILRVGTQPETTWTVTRRVGFGTVLAMGLVASTVLGHTVQVRKVLGRGLLRARSRLVLGRVLLRARNRSGLDSPRS